MLSCKNWSRAEPGVLALGGGALTFEPTRALLRERALCVYLDVPLDILLERLRRSPTIRPLLGPSPTRECVRKLFVEREPLYRQADVIVRAGRRSGPADFARAIACQLAPRFVSPR